MSATDPEFAPASKSKKGDDEDEVATKNISLQIRDLIKKRAEVKKQDKGDSGKDSDRKPKDGTPRNKEKPLPQRNPRIKPRIVSNVQVAPPKPRVEARKRDGAVNVELRPERRTSEDRSGNSKEEWTETRRKQRRNSRKVRGDHDGVPASMGQTDGTTDSRPKAVVRRPPKTAAVMIVGREEGFSYAAALKKARESISLDNLKIDRAKIRKAANCGLLIEVLSPGGSGKAAALRDKLHEVLHYQAVITRLVAKGEIRLVSLDCTTATNEVVDGVAEYGGCLKSDIKVGTIRPLNNGLHTAWVQCPLGAVARLSNLRKIRIGWTMARVEALSARPTQCFKCWRFGHLKNSCSFKKDFSGLCFRCGGMGHSARNCVLPPSCKICLLEGRDHNHRIGSNLCTADRRTSSAGPVSERKKTASDRRPEAMIIDGDQGPPGQRQSQ